MNIEEFVRIVENSRNIVFFGGAGVSTESGIPDFRSADGLYKVYGTAAEKILSHDFFFAHTEEFYRFYRAEMLRPEAKPNVTHNVLARLEREGKLLAVVTQNIDGLHEAAGSVNVFNLHGSVYGNTCLVCGRRFGLKKILESDGVPRCPCGGLIKPDVVLYGETLPEKAWRGAVSAISRADCLIAGGTSLTVYPAAGLIDGFRGGKLIIINKQPTPYDGQADMVLRCALGEVFGKIYA